MAFTRFTAVSATQLAAELSAVKGVAAVVVMPTPADDYYAVHATLAGVRSENEWAETPGGVVTADCVIEHLRALVDAAKKSTATSKRFRRAERGNT